MKEIPIPFVLFAVSIFMLLDLDGFNKLFDIVTVFYLIFLIPLFLLYPTRKAWYNAEHEIKLYSLNKTKKGSTKTWQDTYAGKWVKVERKNFYEFMVANGVPSMIASFKKDSDFAQTFSFDSEDEWRFELKATGTPQLTLPWMKVGKTENDAELTDCKDPSGTPMQLKFWYDENEKSLKSWGINPSKQISLQTRKIDDQGLMHFSHSVQHPDGRTVGYTAVLKRA